MTIDFVPGWIKQKPDPRDYSINHEAVRGMFAGLPQVLPVSVDLRSYGIPVMNQGNLGSCTANALDAMVGYFYEKHGKVKDFQGSRLFNYYYARKLEGTVSSDSGATIRDIVKTFAQNGIPKESLWPYTVSKFKTRPNVKATTDASKRKATAYVLIDQPGMNPNQVLTAVKTQLAAENALEFGTYCYQSILNVGADGMIPTPSPGETPIGGHALCLIGYDDAKKAFLIQNSWGTGWGMKGFGWLPYSYFQTGYQGRPDANDVWTVTKASWSN
jgi:C1A family cysteine protease